MVDWKVQNMIRHADNGGVVIVYWKASIAEDYTVGDNTHHINPQETGQAQFTPDPTADGFIPFDSLTEADVLAWVYTVVNKDNIEAQLQNRLDAKKESISKFVGGMPW